MNRDGTQRQEGAGGNGQPDAFTGADGSRRERPVVIEVRDLKKSFRLPGHRPETLKERSAHPFKRLQRDELKVLDGISFDVRQGEFFGVVGRNGSGKSTLLKLLASIYRPDGGRIRIAGGLAPVIELGVGFKPELAARDNIVINGIMMGLTEEEARARCDSVIEFAELQDFVDLKLKNYSSGMRVRLAFATMVQADMEILLLDEVLAVGDQPFQEKCEQVFRDIRADGRRTVLLISNQMSKVEHYCDRALMIEDGKIARAGAPKDVAEAYKQLVWAKLGNPARLNEPAQARSGRGRAAEADRARIEDLRVEREHGAGSKLEQGEEIRLRARAVAREEIRKPGLRLQIRDESNTLVFKTPPEQIPGEGSLVPEQEVLIEAVVENRLGPGRYQLLCSLCDHLSGESIVASPVARTAFSVKRGSDPARGLVNLQYEVRATRQPARAGKAKASR